VSDSHSGEVCADIEETIENRAQYNTASKAEETVEHLTYSTT